MKVKLLIYLITLIVLSISQNLKAQVQDTVRYGNDFSDLERVQMRYGLYAHIGLNMHYAKLFRGIPEANTCIDFDNLGYENGSGIGFAFGGLFEIPLNKFRFMARFNYYQLDASMTTKANIGPVSVPDKSDTVSAITEYRFKSNLGIISMDFTCGYSVLKAMNLRAGLEFGFMPIANYEQEEYLLSPESGSFVNDDGTHTKVRNKTSGPMSETSNRTAFVLNGDYELPLNLSKRLLLVPEFYTSIALNNLRPDKNWSASQVRAGIAVKWLLPPPEPPPLQPKPPLPPIAVKLKIIGIDNNGQEKENPVVKVEEFINTQIHPLLNYVFFDQSSFVLPERYVTLNNDSANKFLEKSLFAEKTLDVYHNILNIVGKRMRDNSTATLKLVGTNSNESWELNNTSLSKSRAENVKKYLTEVFSIDPIRISISSRNLPETPSNINDIDGISENRRVELYSNMEAILDPVILIDTIKTVEPKSIKLVPEINAPAGVRNLQTQINQGQMLLQDFTDPKSYSNLEWDVIKDGRMELNSNKPVYATITLTDSLLRSVTDTVQIPVNQLSIQKKKENRIGDMVIENYRLITFEFDRPELKQASLKIVEMIKRSIKQNSEVDITGYTDRLGDDVHNSELSIKRANATSKALNTPINKVTGAGETLTLYPNDLPEGRFYCRTVEVQVKTPINN